MARPHLIGNLAESIKLQLKPGTLAQKYKEQYRKCLVLVIYLLIYVFTYLMCMTVCLHVNVCIVYILGNYRDQRRP